MKKYIKYLVVIFFLAFPMLLLFLGYVFIDKVVFYRIDPVSINENAFQANYFAQKNIENKTTVVVLGGGGWGDFWGNELAKQGFVSLSLPYIEGEGLPELPEEINLEYFEQAIRWLGKQPEVDSNKIVVLGAGRNSELALLLGSFFPELISGVVAYSPSAYVWSNTIISINSDEIKARWKYRGIDIPYVPMDKISGNESNRIESLEHFMNGLAKADSFPQAIIQVEKINGPILLFSGKDDQVVPASIMADKIETRLNENCFQYTVQNIKYENAGHLIAGRPGSNSHRTTATTIIKDEEYKYDNGGTRAGDKKAKENATIKLFKFLNSI